jgi:hypothetical protein
MAFIPPGLSEAGRRVISFLVRGAREGIGANELLRSLQSAGLGYRRETFLRDYKLVQGLETEARTLRYVPEHYFPSLKHYPVGKLTQKERFLTYVDVKWQNPETGEKRTRSWAVKHDTLLTPKQIKELVIADLEVTESPPEEEYEGFVPVDVVPVKGVRRY